MARASLRVTSLGWSHGIAGRVDASDGPILDILISPASHRLSQVSFSSLDKGLQHSVNDN